MSPPAPGLFLPQKFGSGCVLASLVCPPTSALLMYSGPRVFACVFAPCPSWGKRAGLYPQVCFLFFFSFFFRDHGWWWGSQRICFRKVKEMHLRDVSRQRTVFRGRGALAVRCVALGDSPLRSSFCQIPACCLGSTAGEQEVREWKEEGRLTRENAATMEHDECRVGDTRRT